MAKSCAELFEGIECAIIGDATRVVSGLEFRSSEVCPGDMFFCIVGLNADGHDFAEDAISRGASVIVCQHALSCDTDGVTLVEVGDTRRVMADVACAFFDHPSKYFSLIGVTGTNGKTTTTYLVDHILSSCGQTTGLIGTVGTRIAGIDVESNHTTPDSIELQSLLAKMKEAGCDSVSMEVSSHALTLDRVWGCKFAVTAFTNMTQDHLDYHHTFEEYFEAKALLFSKDFPAKRVICTGDEWGVKLACMCKGAGDDVITYGSAKYSDCVSQTDISVLDVEYHDDYTLATFNVTGQQITVQYPLTGTFNVDNVMCAIGICMHLGINLDAIAASLADCRAVPGRMEDVSGGISNSPKVIVDYAHTPDALKQTLASLSATTKGKVILVFGCEGNRDVGKRPIMGGISLDADHVVLTTDNTHKDDQDAINEAVLAGMRTRALSEGIDLDEVVDVVCNRRAAMEHAISMAGEDDCVVMTGRGHELYMEYGDKRVFFDDRIEARAALEKVLSEKHSQEIQTKG